MVAVAVAVLLLVGGGLSAAVKFWLLPAREPLPVAEKDTNTPKQPDPPAPEQKEPSKEKQKPEVKAVHPVALLGFEERGVGVKDLGGKVGDLLFAKLAAKPEFYLVDRTDLKKVLDEQQLNLSGAVKADEAVKVGQLTGARILVTGSIVQADKKIFLVAKIISTENGRVFGASVEGAMTDELATLAGKLADAIDETVGKQGEKLVPKPSPAVDRIAELNKKLGKAARPVLWVEVTERHIGQPAVDPAAQTELARFAKETGFELIDTQEGAKGMADVFITGEGFSEVAGRVGGLVSVRARVELKVVDRKTGKVLVADRQTVLLVDASEQLAGKTALQNAAAELAQRILPKIAKNEKK